MSLAPTVEQLRARIPALYLAESQQAKELLDNVHTQERSVRYSKTQLQAFVTEGLRGIWARTHGVYGLDHAALRLNADSLMVHFVNWAQDTPIKLFDELWLHSIASYPGSAADYELCPQREPLERVFVTLSDQYQPQPLISIEDQYGLGVIFSGIDRAEAFATRTFARRASVLNRHWNNLHHGLREESTRSALVFLLEEAKEMRFKPETEPKYPKQQH